MAKGPLRIDLCFSQLPAGPKERHEALVSILGQYVISLRNQAVNELYGVLESDAARDELGGIRRRKFDAIAALPADERGAACEFAKAGIDRIIRLLLTMLSGTGVDQRLGDDHAIRFKLVMEILEVQNGGVVSEETINRGGEKFFADYWGRWLNQ